MRHPEHVPEVGSIFALKFGERAGLGATSPTRFQAAARVAVDAYDGADAVFCPGAEGSENIPAVRP